jgi:predicted amidohydrolase YtcJ
MTASLALFAALAIDYIAVNAHVITADPARPRAQAFAVENGKFLAVGSNAEIRRLAAKNTKILDLKGKTVTPGFNDTHVHPRPVFPDDSPYSTPWLGPDKVKSIGELIAALRRKAALTPPGQLVSGFGYQDTKLGRHPNRHDLDQVSTTHPVSITHSSGHITAVNSYVLRQAGITKDTPNPNGGGFDRETGSAQDGEPNGVIRESARRLLKLEPTPIPEPQQVEGLVRCFREFAARGITSINVAGAGPGQFALYEKALASGASLRIGVMLSESFLSQAATLFQRAASPNLYWTAIKTFQGNSMSGRTCWLSEEYSDRPGYFGIPPSRNQETFDALVKRVHDAGLQLATHANGDREIDMVLTAIERAQAANPRPAARHRIEHASVCTRQLLERAKAASVTLVFHSYFWEHGDKLEAYGEKRLAMVHPHRTALDLGIALAGHSDYPVSAADPLLRIQDMVTRRSESGRVYGPAQVTTVEEAIQVFTQAGAHTTFEEKSKGSITTGKWADFVILTQDPLKIPALALRSIPIEATYLGGQEIFRAPKNAQFHPRRLPPTLYGDGEEHDQHEAWD